MIVELSSREMIQGAFVGMMRQVENVKKQRPDAYGADASRGWQIHIEGCLGEMAFAKHMGLYWSGANEFQAHDVGEYEIRTTPRNFGDLILHPGDDDDAKYVLVTGHNGIYEVRGWIFGKEGKNQEWWRDPLGNRPAYFVPQRELISFDTGWKRDADQVR